MKVRLVDDARRWWRWGSVHLAALAALGAAVLLNVSGAAQAALGAMTPEMRALLPAWLPMVMFVLPLIARVVTTRRKPDADASQEKDSGNGA